MRIGQTNSTFLDFQAFCCWSSFAAAATDLFCHEKIKPEKDFTLDDRELLLPSWNHFLHFWFLTWLVNLLLGVPNFQSRFYFSSSMHFISPHIIYYLQRDFFVLHTYTLHSRQWISDLSSFMARWRFCNFLAESFCCCHFFFKVYSEWQSTIHCSFVLQQLTNFFLKSGAWMYQRKAVVENKYVCTTGCFNSICYTLNAY